jgi:plasmid stabilization system protein ParE
MSPGLRLRPEAEVDLQEAFRWYEGRQSGLGDEFIGEAERCFALIQDNPRLHAEIHKFVRRALLKRFPYGVFYLVDVEAVVILAVLHQARSPELWP